MASKVRMAGENIIEEESLARDMPLNARIHTAEIPPDDPKQLEVVARSLYNQYRHVFKDYEEAEYFTMLPLSMRQRDHVLARAVAFHGQALEEKKNDGVIIVGRD